MKLKVLQKRAVVSFHRVLCRSLSLTKITFITGGLCIALWCLFMILVEYYTPETVMTFCEDTKLRTTATPKAGKVILFSYFGAGSTLLANIFKISPDVFFLDEPLMYTADADMLAGGISLSSRLLPNYKGFYKPPKTLDFTTALLNCSFTAHYMRFLGDDVKNDSSLKDIEVCTRSLKSAADLEKCAAKARERCERSSTIVAKILRLKMWEVDILLSCQSDLKIIQLVGDPRGVAESRLKVDYQWSPETFCHRFNTDAIVSSQLHSHYPGRLITVRLEDLVAEPLKISYILFQFAGINWTRSFSDILPDPTTFSNNTTSPPTLLNNTSPPTLLNNTSPSTLSNNTSSPPTLSNNTTSPPTLFDIIKKSYSLFQWRNTSELKTVRDIQEKCYEAMYFYGYNFFLDEKRLRDMSMSSKFDDYSILYNKAITPS